MTTHLSIPRSVRICWVLFLALLAIGCRTLPETGVRSFADSTSLLSTTLSTAGTTAVSDVALIYTPTDPNSKTEAEELSAELEKEWEQRLKLMAAMNRYAGSLEGLVDAGKSGQANAEGFRDSVKGLVEAAGSAFPGAGSAGQLLIDGGTRIYGEIAKAVAANQIHKAVELADSLVADSSTLIVKDLNNLRSIAVEKRATAVTIVQTRRIHRELGSINDARADAARAAFSNPANPSSDALQKLNSINEQYANLPNNPEYKSYVADLERANLLFETQSALLEQAMLTTQAWAEGHHELVMALRLKRAPSLSELTRLTTDLYEVYKTYREAKSKP